MTEMDAFMEQLNAAYDTAHHYTCFMCQEFAGHVPVVTFQEEGDGVRAIIFAACVTCAKEIPNGKTEESSTSNKGT